jgi:predicted amidohydrolase YtcJ
VHLAPDRVLVNGGLFSAGRGRLPGHGVAVRDGRIVAVAADEAIRHLAGPRTEVVDLAGGLLIPGIQDAHVHPIKAGATMLACDLSATTDARGCLAVIDDYARAHPDRAWVTGRGWSMAFFAGGTPTRQQLDALVPDRPACLTNRDGHGVWVNTRAIELAGLDATTPDPHDGRIEREPDGYPAGTFHEGAERLFAAVLPDYSRADEVAGLLAAQRHLLSLGITGWQDAWVGPCPGYSDMWDPYVALATDGRLVARVVGALGWDTDRGRDQLEELLARRRDGAVRAFRPVAVKILQDGVPENFTAGMLRPYGRGCGCGTPGSGLSMLPPDELAWVVTALDAHGFQVHVHAIGDRAVRETLDAMATARAANGASSMRHTIAHLQHVDPQDWPRFAALDVTATIQPYWAAHDDQMDDLNLPFLDEERAARQYPFAALLAAGAAVAGGSDWPVTTADPWQAMHVAVNRVQPGPGAGRAPFFPHQALSLAQALTAYTAGSARVNHCGDVVGRIEPGYVADLVVLDRDPFERPSDEIAETRTRRTLIAGREVHAADGLDPLD